MKQIFNSFWRWYNKHLTLNIGIAAFLFLLQLIHLYWLTTHVVFLKAFGFSAWDPTPFLENLILIVDYTEIPALITTSLVYINSIRKKGPNFKDFLYLVFLNSQYLHIFWITDEFVVDKFTGAGAGTVLPIWLAWMAIAIDYLEIPVIIETFQKLFDSIGKKDLKKIKQAFEE
jgi:hypothetical protein